MKGLSCPEIGLYTCNVCAWKALQSVAIVTEDEVLGRNSCSNSAWKAVRLWRWINCMSYGVVPSRHLVLALTIRGLRPRLPSLRSVVPSRHKSSYTCTFGCGSERTEICFLARALRNFFPERPFNPALIRITACNQTGCKCIVCTSNPSLMKGLSCPEIGGSSLI